MYDYLCSIIAGMADCTVLKARGLTARIWRCIRLGDYRLKFARW